MSSRKTPPTYPTYSSSSIVDGVKTTNKRKVVGTHGSWDVLKDPDPEGKMYFAKYPPKGSTNTHGNESPATVSSRRSSRVPTTVQKPNPGPMSNSGAREVVGSLDNIESPATIHTTQDQSLPANGGPSSRSSSQGSRRLLSSTLLPIQVIDEEPRVEGTTEGQEPAREAVQDRTDQDLQEADKDEEEVEVRYEVEIREPPSSDPDPSSEFDAGPSKSAADQPPPQNQSGNDRQVSLKAPPTLGSEDSEDYSSQTGSDSDGSGSETNHPPESIGNDFREGQVKEDSNKPATEAPPQSTLADRGQSARSSSRVQGGLRQQSSAGELPVDLSDPSDTQEQEVQTKHGVVEESFGAGSGPIFDLRPPRQTVPQSSGPSPQPSPQSHRTQPPGSSVGTHHPEGAQDTRTDMNDPRFEVPSKSPPAPAGWQPAWGVYRGDGMPPVSDAPHQAPPERTQHSRATSRDTSYSSTSDVQSRQYPPRSPASRRSYDTQVGDPSRHSIPDGHAQSGQGIQALQQHFGGGAPLGSSPQRSTTTESPNARPVPSTRRSRDTPESKRRHSKRRPSQSSSNRSSSTLDGPRDGTRRPARGLPGSPHRPRKPEIVDAPPQETSKPSSAKSTVPSIYVIPPSTSSPGSSSSADDHRAPRSTIDGRSAPHQSEVTRPGDSGKARADATPSIAPSAVPRKPPGTAASHSRGLPPPSATLIGMPGSQIARPGLSRIGSMGSLREQSIAAASRLEREGGEVSDDYGETDAGSSGSQSEDYENGSERPPLPRERSPRTVGGSDGGRQPRPVEAQLPEAPPAPPTKPPSGTGGKVPPARSVGSERGMRS